MMRPTMNAATAVTSTTVVQVLTAFAALTIPSLVPLVVGEAGLHAVDVGTFISIVYAAAALVTIFAGHLVHRFGAIRTCQFAVALCAAGLLMARTGSAVGLVAGAVALGLGYGPVTPASSHLLSQSTSAANRRLIFSLKQTGVPAGTALAGALVPVATLALGWRVALGLVVIVCLLVALGLQAVRTGLDEPTNNHGYNARPGMLSSITIALSQPYLRLLALTAFVLGGAQMCASTFLISYFYRGLGYPPLAAGAMLSVANVAGVVFRLVWGAAADRGANPRLLLAALALLTCFAQAIVAWPSLMASHAAAMAVCFVMGAAAIGWNGVLLAEIAEAVPVNQVSTATAGCLFFSFGGVMTFPAFFGAIRHASGGYSASWLWMAGTAAALALILLVSGRRFSGNVVARG
ncbi:MFS transporter [Paraburkholderia dipogonis]|uniref:MFS transporter n=2 Tax=Paraburkholderia dipogonis TaxID=1211383 RepID=A0A4Y8MR91_9BURK|nr:MFS transporter [Paraburkholderia dipogonis]